MKNYYKIGVNAEVDYPMTRGEEINSGYAMMWRGASRGESSTALYKKGIVGIDLIGKEELLSHPMQSFTNFLVDIAHLMLMLGGLYLIAGAIWGGPRR